MFKIFTARLFMISSSSDLHGAGHSLVLGRAVQSALSTASCQVFPDLFLVGKVDLARRSQADDLISDDGTDCPGADFVMSSTKGLNTMS